MIKINIICVGKIKERYLLDAINEYLKRLSKYAKVNIIELEDEKVQNHTAIDIQNIESRKILTKIKDDDYLIILDLMLPGLNGEEIIKIIKDIPIIVISAKISVEDKVNVLLDGANDYITKPFSPKELVLRIQALFRRIDEGAEESKNQYKYFDGENTLMIDEDIHEIEVNGQKINLTAAEWRIVLYLVTNAPNLITRAQILEECFDYSFESYERVVDTHIKNIRTKLRPGNWIDTVRGYGYRFSGKKA